jgi:DNA-binding response OmpR family regulator
MPSQRILVVDDEYDTAFILKSGLERKGGYDVDAFTDPSVALNDFRANSYDLIVIDIVMPSMNGFDLYMKIKERDNNVKICFLSASDNTYEQFKKCFPTLEEKCFIKKPIRLSELVNEIKAFLSSRQG